MCLLRMFVALSGVTLVVDAGADALNNKENWERDLNDRQKMDPDLRRNSFTPFNFKLRFEPV